MDTSPLDTLYLARGKLHTLTLTVTNSELNASAPAVHYIPKIIRFLGYNPMPPGTSSMERLIAFRKSQGWTQEQMAHHLGIDPSTLQGWESGEQKPSPKKLERIAAVFQGSHHYQEGPA